MKKQKRLIDLIIENIANNMSSSIESLANEISIDFGIQNYCIGSGGSFNVYENISYKQAKKIFENLDVRQCCGKLIDKQQFGFCTFETYHTLESNTGKTTLFMFDIDNIYKGKENG